MNIPNVDPKALRDSPFASGAKSTLRYFKNDKTIKGLKGIKGGIGAASRGIGRFAAGTTSLGWNATGGALTKKVMSTQGGRTMTQGVAKGSKAALNVSRRVAGSSITKGLAKGIARGGGMAGLALGTVAMIGVGIMKGAANSSREIVAERAVQDQRYARNITMMSRLGYTTGTNRLSRYGHTVGLSQALAANRHGRGAY